MSKRMIIVLLYYYIIIVLYYYSIILLYSYIIILLYYYTIIILYYYIIILLYYILGNWITVAAAARTPEGINRAAAGLPASSGPFGHRGRRA